MPGRKDKKGGDSKKSGGREGRGGSDMAAMFGLGMGAGLDVSDADLEAELMALEGKSPRKGSGGKGGKSSKGGGMLSMSELDKMMASANQIGDDEDGDNDEDLSDVDEEELLGELQALEEMETETTPPEPSPPPKKVAAPPTVTPRKPLGNSSAPPNPPSGGGGGPVGVVSERLDLYKRAVQQAQDAGESSKVRRYKRSITTLEQMLRSAKAGKPVNTDDMPPPVNIKDPITSLSSSSSTQAKAPPTKPAPKAPPKATPSNLIDLDAPEFDEFNLSEEELASMAASMVDTQVHSNTAATKSPPTTATVGASHSGSNVVRASHSGSSAPPAASSSSSVKTSPPQPKPRVTAGDSSPPKPKPRPQPKKSSPPPMGPGGLIDLDAPEFDEFNLTDEELAAMAAAMTDDREAKKPKLDNEPSASTKIAPSASSLSTSSSSSRPLAAPRGGGSAGTKRTTAAAPPPPPAAAQAAPLQQVAQSLPATLKKPVMVGDSSSEAGRDSLLRLLTERRDQYLEAAKAQQGAAKKKEYRLIAAQFARVLKGVQSGQDIDLTKMPGPPPGYSSKYNVDVSKFSATSSASAKATPTTTQGQSSGGGGEEQPDAPPTDPEIPTPKTALEALEQRLAKYKEGQRTAQEKGESSRVRRMGRIIKQYEASLRDTRAGKPCDYDELPTPPGYPPIPRAAAGRVPRSRSGPQPPVGQQAVPLPTQSLPAAAITGGGRPPASTSSAATAGAEPSLSLQQIALVEHRMSELKRAAKLEQGKQNRDGALEYLRKAKGLETMLKAAQSGLPVNLEQVPPSPFAELDQTKPSREVVAKLRPAEEKDAATFELLIRQLEKQIEICERNSDTYKKMGSSGSAIEYDNMSQNTQRELLALKGIQGGGYGPPRFSLETRTLTLIHSNPHLNGGSCEVEVVRAINITCPPKYEEKDLDVYVEAEFPYPTDDPPKRSTDVVHKSCSPEFKERSLLFEIDRKHHRSMARAFKRTPLKCSVWQHRSLRKHIFIGQVSVPLESLETKSELHSTLDLLDEKGRKPVGGKLEVFVRLREPLTGRDQEECEEQWVVFKEEITAKSSVPMPKLTPQAAAKQGGGPPGASTNYALLSPVKPDTTLSVAALKFEFSLVASALKAGHKDSQTVQRGRLVKARIESIQQKLQVDAGFRKAYPRQVAKEIQQEQQLEVQLAKQGKSKQAEVVILQKRRAAMEKEIRDLGTQQGRCAS